MNKNELYKLLYAKEKQFESAKLKRTIITILFFAVLYFLYFYLDKNPIGIEIVGTFLVALFVGGFHVWLNAIVFSTLFRKGEYERTTLEEIRRKISEIE